MQGTGQKTKPALTGRHCCFADPRAVAVSARPLCCRHKCNVRSEPFRANHSGFTRQLFPEGTWCCEVLGRFMSGTGQKTKPTRPGRHSCFEDPLAVTAAAQPLCCSQGCNLQGELCRATDSGFKRQPFTEGALRCEMLGRFTKGSSQRTKPTLPGRRCGVGNLRAVAVSARPLCCRYGCDRQGELVRANGWDSSANPFRRGLVLRKAWALYEEKWPDDQVNPSRTPLLLRESPRCCRWPSQPCQEGTLSFQGVRSVAVSARPLRCRRGSRLQDA